MSGTVRLSLAIMTAPPRSIEPIFCQVAAQAAALDSMPTVIVDENRMGCWWCAQQAWQSYHREATHHIVVQDDCLLSQRAILALKQIASIWPDSPVAACYWRKSPLDITTRYFLRPTAGSGVLLMLPTWVIERWLCWCSCHVKDSYPHDDARLSLYCLHTNRLIVHPNPCLAIHDDTLPSLQGHESTRPETSGLQFLTPEQDALAWDWRDKQSVTKVEGPGIADFGDAWRR